MASNNTSNPSNSNKGGGKPNRAQGAARDPTNVAQALEAAKAFAEAKLG